MGPEAILDAIEKRKAPPTFAGNRIPTLQPVTIYVTGTASAGALGHFVYMLEVNFHMISRVFYPKTFDMLPLNLVTDTAVPRVEVCTVMKIQFVLLWVVTTEVEVLP
jgi:hypothetical protein